MPPKLIRKGMDELFPMTKRSKGKHVSTAIHKIMKALYPDRFEDRPIDIVRANLGNAVERMIIAGLAEAEPDRFVRPGELEHEGWYGTPDLWDLGENHGKGLDDWATLEIKLTWASARRAEDIEDVWFWRYWTQLKTYAHFAGQTKGKLAIVFVNGNYSRDPDDPDAGPQCYMWEDEWTHEELLENWLMIKAQC